MKMIKVPSLAFLFALCSLATSCLAADNNAAVVMAQGTVPSQGIFGAQPNLQQMPSQYPSASGLTAQPGAVGALPSAAPSASSGLPPPPNTLPGYPPSRMFGSQLFNGSFRNLYGGGFNPNYQINVGDRIQVRMWGGFNFDGQLPVDAQGNIFLPNVGPVPVAGAANSRLNDLVGAQVRRIFKSNVNVYAALDASQPVKVFVTGFVRQPGLYAGISSESLLSYLDRAGGVDPARGSYVDIAVKRGDKVRMQVNLYDFLLNGQIDLIQLQDGDAIVVGSRKHTFSVNGEVFNSNDFEFSQPEISLASALAVARAKPGATHVSVTRRQGTARRTEYYPLDQTGNITLQDGDTLTVTSDRYAGTIQVRVEGAHSGDHAIVLPYGATMSDVVARIKPNQMSQMNALQLYRVSVAKRQKEMLNVTLAKLEEAALSARSKTSEEANLRGKEAELIGKFVERARTAEPRGQVVLNEAALATTLLEDGDTIVIPERTSLVMMHGEVLFPNAVSWRSGLGTEDYIRQVGGYTQSANTSKIIVIKQNGETLDAQDQVIAAGDQIMVLPKIDSKNIEVTRGITQILYQLAIAAKVLLVGF